MHDAWFDIHDICLISPQKKYLTNFFPLRFFQPFFRHPIHPGRRQNPAFWDPGRWCTQRHLSQQPNGLGSVGWWEDHVGIRHLALGWKVTFQGRNFAMKLSKRGKNSWVLFAGDLFFFTLKLPQKKGAAKKLVCEFFWLLVTHSKLHSHVMN